mmetsp:Transcript_31678/g.95181  ORF Transcript_31678/g.95181 Transcript_31678/m.95181 type:complete len:213 (+) Transcript_31678:719-1357(+)
MREKVAFVDGRHVDARFPDLNDDARGVPRAVQCESCARDSKRCGRVEGLKQNLKEFRAVPAMLSHIIADKDRRLVGSNFQLIVEGVIHNLFPVIPVADCSSFNRILESEHTALGLRLGTDVALFLAHTDHDTLVTAPPNGSWKDTPRTVVTGKADPSQERTHLKHDSAVNLVCDCPKRVFEAVLFKCTRLEPELRKTPHLFLFCLPLQLGQK